MKYGVDYAAPAGANTLHSLRQQGHTFVCRYVSTTGNPKNITRVEAAACKELGMKVVLVFETTANRALDGEQAGRLDAFSAERQARAAGVWGLRKPVIFFAVDFDSTPAQWPLIHSYLKGTQSVLKGRAGVYGGYRIVKAALDSGVVRFAWQTYAWSGGKWDRRAQLQQYSNGERRAGLSVDLDRAAHTDFGQWPRPLIPRPKPRRINKWKWLRWGRI